MTEATPMCSTLMSGAVCWSKRRASRVLIEAAWCFAIDQSLLIPPCRPGQAATSPAACPTSWYSWRNYGRTYVHLVNYAAINQNHVATLTTYRFPLAAKPIARDELYQHIDQYAGDCFRWMFRTNSDCWPSTVLSCQSISRPE